MQNDWGGGPKTLNRSTLVLHQSLRNNKLVAFRSRYIFFLSSVFFGARFSSPLHSHTLPLCFFLFTLFYYYFIFFVSSCSSIIHSRFDHVREDDSVACHFSRVPSFGPPECIIISQSESFTLLFYLWIDHQSVSGFGSIKAHNWTMRCIEPMSAHPLICKYNFQWNCMH